MEKNKTYEISVLEDEDGFAQKDVSEVRAESMAEALRLWQDSHKGKEPYSMKLVMEATATIPVPQQIVAKKVEKWMLERMQDGQTLTFQLPDALACNSGKSLAYQLQHVLGCKFRCKTDYEYPLLTITRENNG